jgi:hypothetical protein
MCIKTCIRQKFKIPLWQIFFDERKILPDFMSAMVYGADTGNVQKYEKGLQVQQPQFPHAQ